MLVAYPSKLGHILDDTPPLLDYSAGSGEFIKYKGRSYCWVEISQEGQILLTKKMMDFLKVRPGMELLSIRSSDIAFTMGAKGPLLEKAKISHALYHIVSAYFWKFVRQHGIYSIFVTIFHCCFVIPALEF